MTGATHILIGLSGAVVAGHAGVAPNGLELLALVVGSLSPDVDAEHATVTQGGSAFKSLVGHRGAQLINGLLGVVSRVARLIFGHRGLLHAPLFGAAIVASGWHWQTGWLCWFGAGYLLHLFGDYMTAGGIPLFAPLSKKRYSGTSLRVGSVKELVVAVLLCAFVIGAGWSLLPNDVKATHRNITAWLAG